MIQVGEKWIRDTILYYSEFRTIFINRPWVATYEYLGWEASPVSLLASEVPEQLFLWLSYPWMGWCSLVVSGMYVHVHVQYAAQIREVWPERNQESKQPNKKGFGSGSMLIPRSPPPTTHRRHMGVHPSRAPTRLEPNYLLNPIPNDTAAQL